MQVKTYLISKAVSYHELILEDGYINKIYMIDNPDQEIYAIPDAYMRRGVLCHMYAEHIQR